MIMTSVKQIIHAPTNISNSQQALSEVGSTLPIKILLLGFSEDLPTGVSFHTCLLAHMQIVSYMMRTILEPLDVLRASAVNREWRRAAQGQHIWLSFIRWEP